MSAQGVVGVTRRGVLASEWIKLYSVRSTYLTMLFSLALGLALGAFDTAYVAHHWSTMTLGDRATFDPVGTSFDGLSFGELAFGVLGVLAISSEYGPGMIRTSLSAVPQRLTLFAAKAAVVAVTTLVLAELFAFATFFVGQRELQGAHLQVNVGQPGVLRAVISAGLYLFVVAMVGFGLGAIIRHSAGAIAALFAVLYLSYGVARAAEGWSYLPDRLLLANAADVLGQSHTAAVNTARLPSLHLAYVDLAVYLLVFLGIGAWRARQDA